MFIRARTSLTSSSRSALAEALCTCVEAAVAGSCRGTTAERATTAAVPSLGSAGARRCDFLAFAASRRRTFSR
jgi:hypothetical protein